MPADVFISYKQEQRDRIELIANRLAMLGLAVWYDARVDAGSTFDDEIDREIRGASAVLVCWSPEAIASRWVRAEASIGLDRDVLVACCVERTELMAPYNLVQAPLLRGWRGELDHPIWLDLLRRLGPLVGKSDLAKLSEARALDPEFVTPPPQIRIIDTLNKSALICLLGPFALTLMGRRVLATVHWLVISAIVLEGGLHLRSLLGFVESVVLTPAAVLALVRDIDLIAVYALLTFPAFALIFALLEFVPLVRKHGLVALVWR